VQFLVYIIFFCYFNDALFRFLYFFLAIRFLLKREKLDSRYSFLDSSRNFITHPTLVSDSRRLSHGLFLLSQKASLHSPLAARFCCRKKHHYTRPSLLVFAVAKSITTLDLGISYGSIFPINLLALTVYKLYFLLYHDSM
jgi:hypothetical protein